MRADSSARSFSRSALLIAAAMLTGLAGGCNRGAQPTGQVVASVDGEEITAAELQFEARLRNLPAGSDAAVRTALLQELIDRKLLAREARRRSLDRTPEHLLTLRRLDEITLAQEILDASKETDTGTLDAKARELLQQNPQRFAARQTLQVDTIALGAPVDAHLRDKLLAAKDISQAANFLSSAGLSGPRASDTWDSVSLPPSFANALAGVRAGQMFVVPNGPGVVVGQVVSASTQSVPPEQRLGLARASIDQQGSQAAMQQLLSALRSKANIQYQKGYGAPQRQ